MTPSHSIPHDRKKRPERKDSIVHGQRRKIPNMQSISGNGENPDRWDNNDDKSKKTETALGTDTSRQEHHLRCYHTEENSGDKLGKVIKK